MFQFHEGFYTDVRIEEIFETSITYTLGKLDDSKIRRYKAAFIRLFDGNRWYYSATSDAKSIQEEIDKLSKIGTANPSINDHPIVKAFEINKETALAYADGSVANISKEDKDAFIQKFFPHFDNRPLIKMWKIVYIDTRKVFNFYSSKGADLVYDVQRAGVSVRMAFSEGEKKLQESFQKASTHFEHLSDMAEKLPAYIERCEDFLARSVPVEPGKHTVILSPLAAGIFAHESFGHKSESDFMVGDETMLREWALGKKVGSDILSIVDKGSVPGSGFVPFDDEGTRCRENYLIKDGILAGRLHSASTAAALNEGLTGNARAMNFEYEPIVRMTTTYILPGDKAKDELFSEVEDGFYIDTINHGSGMSTFTLAPSMAYRIRNGKISEPVSISVISGTVFETLSEIDGLSDKLELLSFTTGGCGKMEQYPLPVGFGGPYVRVRNMNVQ